jgi:hypothetical protein
MGFAADHQAEIKRQSRRGRCLHFDNGVRCNEIISAHSIQRRGQLAHIAENGHIYRLNADLKTLTETGGSPKPKRLGVNRASTFAGFCKSHDNALFKSIDDAPLGPDKEQVALYAYRSVCREYFVKENAVRSIDAVRNHAELDQQQRSMLDAARFGHSLGFKGLQRHKRIYDAALSQKNFHEFQFTYFMSTSRCSVQVSGLLYPDSDFMGRRSQHLGSSEPLDLIAFFTAPTADGWAFCFAWHESSSASCVALVRSLATVVSDGQSPADALLRFSLSCCENHAIRISWWDNLSQVKREEAQRRMELMVHPGIPVPQDYLTHGCEGMADWSFEWVYTTVGEDASQETPPQ